MHGIKIIFEDPNWLIIDKPPGVMSQRGKRLLPNVMDILKGYLSSSRSNKAPYAGCVHRLDTNVGGVMAVAKTPRAARWFQSQLRAGQVEKMYYAVLYCDAKVGAGGTIVAQCWMNKAVRHEQKLRIFSYFEKFTGPTRDCRLEIETVRRAAPYHLVRVRLLTGVYHQIRAQCAVRGMAIFGDVKYGGPTRDKGASKPFLMLHAAELSFVLTPGSANPDRFCSPLPPEFERLCRGAHKG